MSDSVKTIRAPVTIGSITVDGFMLPDTSYRMSQTQAAECIGKSRQGVSDFLRTKTFKRLLEAAGGMSEKSDILLPSFAVEIGEGGSKGETRIVGLPLNVVLIYWVWECHRGSKEALTLIVALGLETLERRFDRAFGITHSEDEWDKRLNERIIDQLEIELAEVMAEVDVTRKRERLLEQQLRKMGVEQRHGHFLRIGAMRIRRGNATEKDKWCHQRVRRNFSGNPETLLQTIDLSSVLQLGLQE